MSFDLATWRSLSDDAAQLLAEEIAEATDSTVVEIRPGRIALFERDDLEFALVPGGEVTVGFAVEDFEPTPEQAASFAESAANYSLPEIRSYLTSRLSPRRTVTVPSLLVAVEAYDAADGDVPDYEGEIEDLAESGLRLPTPDEWEWACGAGATTLFRWGDSCPLDRYPVDRFDTPAPHRAPNVFGLKIAQDPYNDERTADPGVICGGDGGTAICGGYGFFLGWLPLATSYRDSEYAQWISKNTEDLDQMFLRPVLDLSKT